MHWPSSEPGLFTSFQKVFSLVRLAHIANCYREVSSLLELGCCWGGRALTSKGMRTFPTLSHRPWRSPVSPDIGGIKPGTFCVPVCYNYRYTTTLMFSFADGMEPFSVATQQRSCQGQKSSLVELAASSRHQNPPTTIRGIHQRVSPENSTLKELHFWFMSVINHALTHQTPVKLSHQIQWKFEICISRFYWMVQQ